jgi:preprotein translocase subunit SecB
MVKAVKLSVPDDMAKFLGAKAKKLGLTLTTFCTNIIFEYARKEADKK